MPKNAAAGLSRGVDKEGHSARRATARKGKRRTAKKERYDQELDETNDVEEYCATAAADAASSSFAGAAIVAVVAAAVCCCCC